MTVPATRIEQLFEQYAPGLLLYARQWTDAETANDVLQEAFTRLLSQRKEPAVVQAWLYRTARCLALNKHREQRRRRDREVRSVASCEELPLHRADDRLDAEAVREVLIELPLEQRETIIMRIWGQMSLAEIGEATRAPVSTVFNRYRAGLAAIRKHFERSLCEESQTTPDSS
jgi:RNA polymerase sigma-70 factor, ECF subfamily